ncbi:hypothetical protein GCM10010965_11540 [Caldalkalibacillus thermarum]|uniref:hypothetical protein n=1 Tax=Caldalkalibacillus thermarum TaxID=296745 RepID=UPI00166312E9|nr:hypothetical protein [Caldalkalibacillus thermarum]GGK20209.1 hypothetical protein GCM10010965_11540 [Caldalkalibacillus thermarum]
MFWLTQNLVHILMNAVIILFIQLIAVVLASRFGLYVWLLKRIFAFRARVLKEKAKKDGRPSH